MVKAKARIVEFIDYKGLSKRKFCESVNMAHTIFNNDSAIGTDKLELIFTSYPELSMEWVITGRGEMLYKEPEMQLGNDKESSKAIIDVMKEEVFELRGKLLKCYEENKALQKGYVNITLNDPLKKEPVK